MALGNSVGYNTIIHLVLRTNYPPAEMLPAYLAPMYPNRTGPLVEYLISKWINGSMPGELSADMSYNTVLGGTFVAGSGGTEAHGTVTFTAGSGAVGATINGRLVTVVWAVSDAATAQAFAAAVLADPVIGGLIVPQVTTVAGATSPGVTTLKAAVGPYGQTLANAITLVLSGTGTTVSGATLTGGVNATLVQATSNG
jgi:hypothetical protein